MFSVSETQNAYVLKWAIENFSLCTQQKGQYIESTAFREQENHGSEWIMRIYPNGLQDASNISFELYLKSDTYISEFIVSYIVSVIARDESEQHTKEIDSVKFHVNGNRSSRISDFMKRDDIISNRSFLLPKDKLSLQCVIKSPVKQHSAISKVRAERMLFTWSIKHFSAIEVGQNDLKHPIPVSFAKAPSLTLRFCLNGDSISEASVEIDCIKESRYTERYTCNYHTQPTSLIHRHSVYDDVAVSLSFSVSVLDARGNAKNCVQCDHVFNISGIEEIFRLPSLMKRKELMAQESHALQNDELNLLFLVQISDGTKVDSSKEHKLLYLSIPKTEPCTTHNNLGEILAKEKQFCDIILKIDNETFLAHKAVLCAQSPMFLSMLKSDKNKGVLDINNMDSKTLEVLLLYIYTSKLDESLDLASITKVYAAAHEYQLVDLKDKCSSIIISNISTRNVWDIASFAVKFDDVAMTTATKSFVSNYPCQSLEGDGWGKVVEIFSKEGMKPEFK